MRRLTKLALTFAALGAGLLALPLAAGAQVIDPGMTREQVLERLGQPNGERTTGAYTYIFFRNGCERTCGMSDLVILENGAVVDAIFRRAGRSFSGSSSSPTGTRPEPTNATGNARTGEIRTTGGAGGGAQQTPAEASGRAGGIVTGQPAAPAAQPAEAATRVTPGSARLQSSGPAAGTAPATQGAAVRPDAATNAVPLATPPTVTRPTVTPPTGSVPAQGAAPAPTNAPASNAGPASPNPRAPAATPPGAPSPTRPDTGANPTPATGTTPPAGGTAPPTRATLDLRLDRVERQQQELRALRGDGARPATTP